MTKDEIYGHIRDLEASALSMPYPAEDEGRVAITARALWREKQDNIRQDIERLRAIIKMLEPGESD
jgi:hypothetical protein